MKSTNARISFFFLCYLLTLGSEQWVFLLLIPVAIVFFMDMILLILPSTKRSERS